VRCGHDVTPPFDLMLRSRAYCITYQRREWLRLQPNDRLAKLISRVANTRRSCEGRADAFADLVSFMRLLDPVSNGRDYRHLGIQRFTDCLYSR
jgi:hypothetical protein